MEEDLLALGRRRVIFEHIGAHPGTYLREMETALGLSVGDLQYHLSQLEKGKLIYAHDDGRRKGYFVTDQVQYFDKEILAFLRMRTPRRIVLHLLLHPDSSFREILAQFRFTKGALSFHLKRLVKAGLIARGKREKEAIFKVADEERTKNILITYRASMADEVLDGVVDVLTKI
jgi:predicted transcriptional regulator